MTHEPVEYCGSLSLNGTGLARSTEVRDLALLGLLGKQVFTCLPSKLVQGRAVVLFG